MPKQDSITFIVIMPFTKKVRDVYKIVNQYLNAGLKWKGIRSFTFTRKTAKAFLNKRVKKDVLNETVDVMCKSPSMLIILSGKNAITRGGEIDKDNHSNNYKWYNGVYTPVNIKDFERSVKVILKLIT